MKKLISGFFAGMMISIGGAVFLACYQQYKVIGALFFCVGLLTVCWKGFSLYTGKIGGVIQNHSKEDISILLLGLLGNFIATVVFGYMIAFAVPDLKDVAYALCTAKLQQSLGAAFLRGLLCGILIYIAVDIYKNHKTTLGVIFAVPAFILSGYEHSIADMFYFATSHIVSADAFVFILTIVIGNSVGGLLIPVLQLVGELCSKVKLKKSPADSSQPVSDGALREQPVSDDLSEQAACDITSSQPDSTDSSQPVEDTAQIEAK